MGASVLCARDRVIRVVLVSILAMLPSAGWKTSNFFVLSSVCPRVTAAPCPEGTPSRLCPGPTRRARLPPHRDRPRQSQKRRDVALLRSSPAPLPRARRRPPPRGHLRDRRRGEGSGPTRGEHRGVGRVSTLRLRGSGRPARLLRGVHRVHRPRREGRRTRPRALAASLPDPSRTPRNTAEPTLTRYDDSRPSSSGGAFLGRSARVQSITHSLQRAADDVKLSPQKFSPKTFSTAKFYRRIDRARPAPASPFDSSCTSPSGSPAGGGTPTIA